MSRLRHLPVLCRCGLFSGSLLFASAGSLRAASNGTTAAEFLRFGAGKPMGMQDASGSIIRDVTAIYWNPAGLAALKDRDAYVSHRMLPNTVSYDFLGVAMPIFKHGPLPSALGYSLQLLSQGSIEKLDNAGNNVGSFSALNMAHTLAWATRWNGTRGGVSVRWIQESVDNTRGNALAGGFGVQHDFGKAVSAGFSVDNVGSQLRMASESFSLPLTARLGGSYIILQGDLLLASDVSVSRDQDARWHAGLAYRIFPPREDIPKDSNSSMTVRCGYVAGKKDSAGPPGFAAGLGIGIRSFRADFSYQPFGELGNSLQLGIGYRF